MSSTMFVNVYLVDRAYGGPEEGGWWYDYGQILAVYPVTSRSIGERLVRFLEHCEYSNEGRRDISSVLSEGVYEIRIQDFPGESWPQQRPHYE